LVRLRDQILPAMASAWGDVWYDTIWIDSNWSPVEGRNVVDQFVYASWRESRWYGIIQPVIGQGVGQWEKTHYSRPSRFGKDIWYVGPDSHSVPAPDLMCGRRVVINVDEAKHWAHLRLSQPVKNEEGEIVPGSLSLFTPPNGDHAEFVRHMLAERMVREFKPGVGETMRWLVESKTNHYLDCVAYACSGARSKYCGVSVALSIDQPEVRRAARTVDVEAEPPVQVSEIPFY